MKTPLPFVLGSPCEFRQCEARLRMRRSRLQLGDIGITKRHDSVLTNTQHAFLSDISSSGPGESSGTSTSARAIRFMISRRRDAMCTPFDRLAGQIRAKCLAVQRTANSGRAWDSSWQLNIPVESVDNLQDTDGFRPYGCSTRPYLITLEEPC